MRFQYGPNPLGKFYGTPYKATATGKPQLIRDSCFMWVHVPEGNCLPFGTFIFDEDNIIMILILNHVEKGKTTMGDIGAIARCSR